MLKMDVTKEIVEFPKWVDTKALIPHATGLLLPNTEIPRWNSWPDEVDVEKRISLEIRSRFLKVYSKL